MPGRLRAISVSPRRRVEFYDVDDLRTSPVLGDE
jgi:hypothetical protein